MVKAGHPKQKYVAPFPSSPGQLLLLSVQVHEMVPRGIKVSTQV